MCERIAHGDPGHPLDVTLWLVDLASGEGRELAPDLELWPTEPVWAPDSRALYVVADQEGRTPVFRIEVGGGETHIRGNTSHGDGMWKTTDGGRTWTSIGLRETRHIARVRVHPTNPDIVYVGALGHAFGNNPERGVFKSTDGGTTWRKVLFRNDSTGISDLVMDPNDPNTLYAASWERVRGPYFLKSGGPGSALWKTTDAGKTWREIQGGGFPSTPKGRIHQVRVSSFS